MTEHAHHQHNHNHCVKTAMENAALLCEEKGVRLTDTRKRVLELIWQGHEAVKAYDLIQQFSDGGTKPPTVYRALDFLLEQGLIHRIDSLNAFIGCPHPDHHDECGLQVLVCDECHLVEELHTHDAVSTIADAASATGFKVVRPVVEVHGLCEKCQA